MTIQFFEKILINASQKFPTKIGEIGIVLGISNDDERVYSYSVFFDGDPEVYSFGPNEIEGTGQIVDRSEIYDEEDIVRVRVNDGRGEIV